MEVKVLQGVKLIGYVGPAIENNNFGQVVEEEKNVNYTNLISFVTNELRVLCGVDEKVNAISNVEDYVTFLMELSSFLKELGCPHESFVQGHISDRLSTKESRLLLLDYLVTELMAARIIQDKTPEKKIELKLDETTQASNMRKILMNFGFSKPPANITPKQLFQKLIPSVQSAIQKGGVDLLGNPIFNGTLTEQQWNTLNGVQKDLHDEYKIRREMLLTRLDCTIQSFQWSDKMKGKDQEITKKYCEKRKEIKIEPDVSMADLLSAREDLAIIEKTSNASVRKNTKSSINSVIIGQVPDRGGRTSEQAPPPPEMPSWQQRSAGPSSNRGGGRGGFQNNQRGNFGGGDYGNRGGDHNNRGSNYSNRGGNYSNRGSDYSNRGSDYSNRGIDYSNRGSDYSNRGSDYNNRGGNRGYGNSRSSNESSKCTYDNYGSNYDQSKSRGGNMNFDSAGSYSNQRTSSNDYNNSGSYNKRDSDNYYNKGTDSYDKSYERGGSYSKGSFDSAGSYGNNTQDYQSNEPKRAKTYDYFQTNKSTYADQYVQESQNNQQYQPRGRGGGRGKSNYNAGGSGRNNYY